MQNVQQTHDQMYIRVHSLTSPSADPWLSDLRHEYERCRDIVLTTFPTAGSLLLPRCEPECLILYRATERERALATEIQLFRSLESLVPSGDALALEVAVETRPRV